MIASNTAILALLRTSGRGSLSVGRSRAESLRAIDNFPSMLISKKHEFYGFQLDIAWSAWIAVS